MICSSIGHVEAVCKKNNGGWNDIRRGKLNTGVPKWDENNHKRQEDEQWCKDSGINVLNPQAVLVLIEVGNNIPAVQQEKNPECGMW